ncbi:MAG: OmpA family protein, partial [Flavobacteriales bacterium]
DKQWSESDVNRRKYVFFQSEISKLKLMMETEIGLYSNQNLLVYSHQEEVEISPEFIDKLLNYSSDTPLEITDVGLNSASEELLRTQDLSTLGAQGANSNLSLFEKELLKMMSDNNQKMDLMQVQINQLREDQMKIFQQQQEQTNAVLQAQIDNLRGMVIELVKISNAPELAQMAESELEGSGRLPVENLPSSISFYFDKNSYVLNAEYKMMLAEVVDILARNPRMKLLITGMTDQSGNDAYNLDLSRKRAGEVKKFLNQSGIGQDRLITKYYGDTKSDSESASDRKVIIEFLAQ